MNLPKKYLIPGFFALLMAFLIKLPCENLAENSSPSTTPFPSRWLTNLTTDLPSGGSNSEFFSVSPIALSDFINITPLGNPNPPAHTFPTDHIYFYVKRAGPASGPGGLPPAAEVTVFAPGDITILQVNSKEYLSSTQSGFKPHTDYQVEFSTCKEFRARFDHVASLSDKIKSQFKSRLERDKESDGELSNSSSTYSTGGSTIKYHSTRVDIKLKAGEVIGTAGGPNGSNNLDFWAFDYRIAPHVYANPSRWNEDSFYIVCAIDYFIPTLRDTLRKRFGGFNGTSRTALPLCGEVAQDKPGTAQGVWFVKGTPVDGRGLSRQDPHLALVPDNVDPSKGVFSMGISMEEKGLSSGAYHFGSRHSGLVNRDFREITADGNVYCYETEGHFRREGTKEIILLQLINATTVRIEKLNAVSRGDRSWKLGSNYVEFER